jgi:hypothetical protein
MLDGRPGGDVFPARYRANTAATIRRLAAECGLEVEKILPVATTAQFVVILPVALLELLWIRLLMTRGMASLRQALIVTLRKPAA